MFRWRSFLCTHATLLVLLPRIGLADGVGMRPSFHNPTDEDLELRWDDGSAYGVFISTVPAQDRNSVNTFVGHSFKLTRPTTLEIVASFRMEPGVLAYTLPGYDLPKVEEQSWSTEAVEEAMDRLQNEARPVDFLHSKPAYARDGVPMRMVIKNFRPYTLVRYWDNGGNGVFQGDIRSGSFEDGVTTYSGHAFNMMREHRNETLELIERFVMKYDQRVYVIEPEEDDTNMLQSTKYLEHAAEMTFRDEYLADMGVPWLGAYPPIVPILPMHEAPSDGLGTVARKIRIRPESRADDMKDDTTLELIALSSGPPQGPRAFLIPNLLTNDECEHVIRVSTPLLSRSQVGNGDTRASKQNTRTSESVFLPRHKTPTFERIHLRFADVLNVTDEELRKSAEALQVVRYLTGQEYAPHYDYSSNTDRLATLLVYLERPDAEGGTSFPRAFGDRGLVVWPARGSAVLFYSRLADGNLDEQSLHAGMPVRLGTKMVCNLWMHGSSTGGRYEL